MIQNISAHASVYPGVYERPWSETELNEELCKTDANIKIPFMSVRELAHHYRIEIAVPGYKKQDFLIRASGRVLSVSGMNKRNSDSKAADCECMIRSIVLPFEVDTNFVTAEYRNGILQICLFKSNLPVENSSEDIIVY